MPEPELDTERARAAGRGRVLVVEDDRSIAQVLVDVLGDEGYEVRHAAEGYAALATLRVWLPDVILLDLMMPRMDGWAFRAAQRQMDAGIRDVPVVVVTAAREGRLREDELAADAILSKPFDLDQVLSIVDQLAAGLRGAPLASPQSPSLG